jgi:hypothetical protein
MGDGHRIDAVPALPPAAGGVQRRLPAGTAKDVGRLGHHAIPVIRGPKVLTQLSQAVKDTMLPGDLRIDPLQRRADGAGFVTDKHADVLQAAAAPEMLKNTVVVSWLSTYPYFAAAVIRLPLRLAALASAPDG